MWCCMVCDSVMCNACLRVVQRYVCGLVVIYCVVVYGLSFVLFYVCVCVGCMCLRVLCVIDCAMLRNLLLRG